jgi:hypothetical protein
MVRVFAIGPKVRGFKPGRDDGFLRRITIRSTPSFGEERKPEAPRREIIRHTKITSKNEEIYFEGYINIFLRKVPPDLLLDDCAGRNARAIWWTNQESPVDIIRP